MLVDNERERERPRDARDVEKQRRGNNRIREQGGLIFLSSSEENSAERARGASAFLDY